MAASSSSTSTKNDRAGAGQFRPRRRLALGAAPERPPEGERSPSS
jgi:hypothetical protein